jgi:ABC-type transporter Mla subunit MlaD
MATINLADKETLDKALAILQNSTYGLAALEMYLVNKLNPIAAKVNTLEETVKNGGVPVVKSVQRGVITTAYNNTTQAYTDGMTKKINAVNPNKTIVIAGGSNAADERNNVSNTRIELIDSTTIQIVPVDTNRTASLSYQVIEFF